MDVVRRSVEALRGSIEIASKPGEGLTVTLRLPLTLAIIDGLLVRVGDAHFVLPLANSLECVELTRQDILDAHGKHLANVRGETHSLHPAQRVFPDGRGAARARADHGGRNRARALRLRRGSGARRSSDRDQEPGQALSQCPGGFGRHHPRQRDRGSDSRSASSGAERASRAPHRPMRSDGRKARHANGARQSDSTQSNTSVSKGNRINGTQSNRKETSAELRPTAGQPLRNTARPFERARARRHFESVRTCEMQQVSQEILRLVEASRQGRLDERGKSRPVSGHSPRNGAGHQRNAGRDSAAHRRRQPHSGADLRTARSTN